MRILRENPRAFGLAVLVHLVLLAVLIFSLDWEPEVKSPRTAKQAPVQAIAVDGARLDAELKRKQELEQQRRREAEQAAQRKIEAERQRKAKVAAQKKAEAERRQKAELEAKRKAQAAAKQKAEAERKRKAEQEAKKQAEAERLRKAEQEAQRKAEADRKRKAEQEAKRKAEEEARRKAEEEAKRQAEEEARRQAEAELQARLAAEQERRAAQRRSALQRMIDEYVLYIRDKVQRSWIRPSAAGSGLACTVTVRLLPSGDVVDVRVVRGSGSQVFDQSVKTAVLKASPLPMPPDPEVMEQFRTISFEFRPDN